MNKALILVVDDQAANIQAVGALLAKNGYEVMPALSGEQALARVAQKTPNLVLLDMQMPGMNGFEVCARLKADAATADIPIIFLTASHEREILVHAFAQGAVDYVTKPFMPEELLARVKTHVELKAARDHLVTIARERAELTQIVAHDLKNPLTSILFTADMLERSQSKPERLPELVRGLRDSANRCVSFIDGYLGRWAQSDTPRRLELAAFPLARCVIQAAEGLKLKAENRRMRIAVQLLDEPTVRANEIALQHVLENLISNALRYAPEGSTVDVECSTGRSGMAKVSVMDRGPGVAEADRNKLFKRYTKLANAEGVAHSSGLGLAIAKEEMDRMGGHLWYEERDGGGACFSLVLPQE